MSRSELFRQLLAEQSERDSKVASVNNEYSKLLDYIRNNENIAAQEQQDDTSLSEVLIRYIKSLEEQNAQRHFVWCNLSGDSKRGGFSNSWEEKESVMSEEEARALMEKHPELKSTKLIEYRCLTDPEFRFNRFMRLR